MTRRLKLIIFLLIVIASGIAAVVIFLIRSIPTVSEDELIVQPQELKKQEPLSLYTGKLVERANELIFVQLGDGIVAGFAVDEKTQFFKIKNGDGSDAEIILFASVKTGGMVSVAAVSDPDTKILTARQIIFQ